MSGSQLKRVEKAIEAMRADPHTPKTAETTEALQDLVDALRAVERRLAALEGKGGCARLLRWICQTGRADTFDAEPGPGRMKKPTKTAADLEAIIRVEM